MSKGGKNKGRDDHGSSGSKQLTAIAAKSIGVSQRRIGEIISGKRAITADTALRLARFFGTDAQSWMNLQAHYDLQVESERLADKLDRVITHDQIANR